MVRSLLGPVGDFREGELRSVTAEGRPLVVAMVDGRLYAMDGRCSHMGFDLSRNRPDGHMVTCKLHGAQFDIRTGERVRNASAHDLKAYPVVVEEGAAYVELP